MIYMQRGQAMPAQSHYIERHMRSIQKVFDIVINHGYYNPYLRKHYCMDSMIPLSSDGHRRSYYMCNALNFAEQDRLITLDEYYQNTNAIQNYLQSSCRTTITASIVQVWRIHNLVCEPIDLVRLYRDWESRPSLDKSY